MNELPEGYVAVDGSEPGSDGWRARRTSDDAVVRVYQGSAPYGAMASITALAWARCAHPALVPILDVGAEHGSWFAVPESEVLGDVSIEECIEVLQAVQALHSVQVQPLDLARSVVRVGGRVMLRPPWPSEPATDLPELARLLFRAVGQGELREDTEQVVLRVDAPECVGGVIGALRSARGLASDAAEALGDPASAVASVGTKLSVAPRPAAVALLPAAPAPPAVAEWPHALPLRVRRQWTPPLDGEPMSTLWQAARDVAGGGRPQAVVLSGAADDLAVWCQALARALERGAFAERISILGGTPADLRTAFYPGGADADADAFEQAWARAAGDPAEGDADRVRRWAGPLREGEARAPASVGRRELQRLVDARASRGLVLVTIEEASTEGVAVARCLCRGDVPVLVLLTVEEGRLAHDDRFREALAATVWEPVAVPPCGPAFGEWVRSIEAAGAAESLQSDGLRDAAMRLERAADEGRLPELEAVDVDATAEALGAWCGAPHRVRDGLHLVALAGGLPVAVADGFLGPVLGLWGGTALASAQGGLARVHPDMLGIAEARDDVAYLHRRLAMAWGRTGRADAPLHVAKHAVSAADPELAWASVQQAAEEALQARDVALLTQVCEVASPLTAAASDRVGRVARWRAHASVMEGVDGAASWAALVEASDEGTSDHAAGLVGLAEVASLGNDEAALKKAVDKAVQAAQTCGDLALEGRALAAQSAFVDRVSEGKATSLYHKALHRLGQGSNPWRAARVLLTQADGRARRGELSDARELYAEAAESFLEADDGPRAHQAILGIAMAFLQEDDLDAAMARANDVQEQARGWMDHEGVARAVLVRARVERHAGAGSAGSLYERSVRDATELGLADVVVEAHIGMSLLALARGDQHAAYQSTTAAAAALEALPGHPLWARYRLAVAAQLAKRGDHMQTWQWLWSANELGLVDAERDVAEMATSICNTAKLEGWGNVIRVAAAVAVEQLRRLGDPRKADLMQRDITGFITQ